MIKKCWRGLETIQLLFFVFRYSRFTLRRVSSWKDECLGPAEMHLPIHSLSTPNILLTISFAAVKNKQLQAIAPRTRKREYSCHAFSSKTTHFHTPPNHSSLSSDSNASQTLALLMLTSCLCMGFHQMKRGGVVVTTEGPEKKGTCKGRCAGD